MYLLSALENHDRYSVINDGDRKRRQPINHLAEIPKGHLLKPSTHGATTIRLNGYHYRPVKHYPAGKFYSNFKQWMTVFYPVKTLSTSLPDTVKRGHFSQSKLLLLEFGAWQQIELYSL